MSDRRVGLWLVGAYGGVGSTAVLGLSAWKRGLIDTTGLTTAMHPFDELDLDEPGQFVVGGHDIRQGSFCQTTHELHERSNVFSRDVLDACRSDLATWSESVRPGTLLQTGSTIQQLSDLPAAKVAETPKAAVARIREDLRQFQMANRLDQMVVVNVASTEPPFALSGVHQSVGQLNQAAEEKRPLLPASSLYAWAALDLGVPYINFTPSLGASLPALLELAHERRTVTCGKDGKTGETLLKTVLAPMFALRNLKVLSWVGHNIFGNRDGVVLNDPANKASKINTKDQVIAQIVGYKPQTHVSIEYIPSLDDWKTAWDHIHFQGFLGTKMTMQFTWQGCDSLLAAPLVLDLARLTLLSQRRGEVGILRHLACFFKSPMGVEQHDFFEQFRMLEAYIRGVKQ